MKRTFLAVCLLTGTAQAAEYRTVSWYADHPMELAGVLKLCRDNAGLARHNANCINADEAQILVTQREMNRGSAWSPYSARYWAARPSARAQEVWECDAMDKAGTRIDTKTARICLAARAGG
jgi:hypothetical protein